jgi:hypothetical protein
VTCCKALAFLLRWRFRLGRPSEQRRSWGHIWAGESVRWTPANPMARDEIIAKSLDLITPVMGAATGAKLMERVLDLENLRSVRELRPLWQRA